MYPSFKGTFVVDTQALMNYVDVLESDFRETLGILDRPLHRVGLWRSFVVLSTLWGSLVVPVDRDSIGAEPDIKAVDEYIEEILRKTLPSTPPPS